MAYRRGISTLGCPEMSLEQVLALVGRHGLDGCEIRALAGSLKVPEVLAQAYGSPAELARRLALAPARIVAFDTSLRLVGSTAAERHEFLEFIPWAEALGVAWLRVFDGGREADAAELAEAAATLGWWRSVRQQHGLRTDVMIETHDSLFTAEKIRRLAAAVPGAAILWDTHHTWKRGGEDPVATWQAIAPQVVHVHVKDSVSRPSEKHPFTYVLPGEGEFPAAPLLARLAAEYRGVVSLEWERLWHPYLPPLDEALDTAARRRWW